MTQPDFTIVTTIYRREDVFWRMLDSVMMQTHANWELRLLADGPHPGLRERLDTVLRCNPRLHDRMYYEEKLRFPGTVGNLLRREGLRQARGKYVCWVGHDCILYPDYLATHWELLAGEDAVSVVRINHWQVDESRFRCFGRFPKVPAAAAQSGEIDLTCYAAPTHTARLADAFALTDKYAYNADFLNFDRLRGLLPVRESEKICAAHF